MGGAGGMRRLLLLCRYITYVEQKLQICRTYAGRTKTEIGRMCDRSGNEVEQGRQQNDRRFMHQHASNL